MLIPKNILLWVDVACGFLGCLTVLFAWRQALRWWRPAVELEVFLSPKGGCTDALVAEIGRAKKEILLLAAAFTARPIAQALLDAKTRGVHIDLVLDASGEADTQKELGEILGQGIVPQFDRDHARMNHKVVLIDRSVLITGSFDFTPAAESESAENVLVVRHHSAIVEKYRACFLEHKAHAKATAATGAEGGGASASVKIAA